MLRPRCHPRRRRSLRAVLLTHSLRTTDTIAYQPDIYPVAVAIKTAPFGSFRRDTAQTVKAVTGLFFNREHLVSQSSGMDRLGSVSRLNHDLDLSSGLREISALVIGNFDAKALFVV